jgi:hypothetical protein
MDGCTYHDTGRVTPLLEANGIVVEFLPPHSSHQIQALDLGIFAIFKKSYMKRLEIAALGH